MEDTDFYNLIRKIMNEAEAEGVSTSHVHIDKDQKIRDAAFKLNEEDKKSFDEVFGDIIHDDSHYENVRLIPNPLNEQSTRRIYRIDKDKNKNKVCPIHTRLQKMQKEFDEMNIDSELPGMKFINREHYL